MIKESDKLKKEKAKAAKKAAKKKEKKEEVIHADGLGEIKNPVETLFGRILIWILAGLMVASIIVTFVYLLWEQIF